MNRFEFYICVPAFHPALPGHFLGHPIVPGLLLIDHVLAQMSQLEGLELVRLKYVKFSSVLFPDERAQVECFVDGEQATFLVSSTRKGTKKILANAKMLMRMKSHESLG